MLEWLVVLGLGIGVGHQNRNRRTKRLARKDTRQNLALIALLALGGNATLARAAAVEFGLNIGL
jgi:hypothetical protein